MHLRSLLFILAIIAAARVHADPAAFDLAGPTLEVNITRGAKTLPASEVPNLLAGDRIWIKADLPATQSAHFLMVAAFLSGSTNPPPENWFFPCKTWTGKCSHDGLTVTVPEGAQQVLVFLAPETGGDYRTLVSAVRGRPGAFVRTSQDLNQAALDRARLERYLAAIRALSDADPSKLTEAAPLLARSLAIKIDGKCLDRSPDLQAPCLMQGHESLILNDGHSTSIVEALTSGPGSDLAMEASYTPQLSYGYYSPYIASVLDIARIMDSFRTAQYQYIPALASPRGDQLALTLNTAPSFHNPQSVMVVALPAVETPQLPPLHAVNPKEIYCAGRSALVLPVDGAPLVFSTAYAHDVTLSLTAKDGRSIELPATADASRGGYVVDTAALPRDTLGDTVHASLQGYWGFEPYHGPGFLLMNTHADHWELAAGDEDALVAGRQDTVHLQADTVSCVDGIVLQDPAGKELKVDWKTVKPNELEVKLPLQGAQPGAMTLLVTEAGVSRPLPISIQAFSEAGHFDGFSMHAGDAQGLLKGNRLDQVVGLTIRNVAFVPGELSTRNGADELPMVAQDAQAAAGLKQERGIGAKVTLKDGRVLPLVATVDAPRPRVLLIGKMIQPSPSGKDSNIQLTDQSEIPQDASLSFAVRTQWPAAFAHDENVEVAAGDDSSATVLSFANGGITLENAQVAVVTVSPAKAFGASAYGPLQFRVVAKGVAGDWQPLGTLVRLPVLKNLTCPSTPELACKLSGSSLFLVDSISNDRQFTKPVQVPDGFLGSALPVPHPIAGPLFVKLRDDPAVINSATLETQTLPPTADDSARASARQTALPTDSPPVPPHSDEADPTPERHYANP
jgi:hypothetical protein